jgi:hypothetical protein
MESSASFINHLGFQAPREQDQSWQNRPNTQFTGTQFPQSSSFNTQNSQILLPKSQSGQGRISLPSPVLFSFFAS